MKTFFLAFCILMFTNVAHAQIVNMQNALNGNISEGPGVLAEVRQEKKVGNTNTERLSGQGNFTFKNPDDLWLLVLKREYSVEDGESSSDSHFYHLRYRYKLDERWGVEAYGQEDADRFRRSLRRTVYGAGPRFQWSPIEKLQFALSVAYMYEKEQFSNPNDEIFEADRVTRRVSNVAFVSYDFDDWGSLANVVYYQPELGHYRNHRTLNELTLSLKVNKFLSYRFTHTFAYNHRPAPGIEKNDKSFLQSLVLKI